MTRRKKLFIAVIALGVICAGLYWRQPLAQATMKLLKVAQGVIRMRSSPKNGLVGYWTFDDCDNCTTAADKSGGGNTGTMYDNVTAANLHTTGGKIGNGLSLDGSNDFVEVTDSALLDGFSAMTVSGWIKPTGSFGANWWEKTIVTKYSYSTDISWGLWSGVGQLTFLISTDGGTSGRTWITGGTIVADTWQHVAGIYNGSTMKVYINGVEVNSVDKSGTVWSGTHNLWIGDYYSGDAHAGFYFNGLIDDVRVYNRALSADEITRLYEEGSFRTTINANQNSSFNSGLVGMWSFNGPDVDWASTTAEILDRSGNGNNGDAVSLTKNDVRAGIVGQALNFDGVDDYVDIGSGKPSALNIPGAVTISAWINPSSVAAGVTWIAGDLDVLGTGGSQWSLEFNRTAGRLSMLSDAFTVALTGNTTLSTGQWYYVAGVRSGSTGNWTYTIYLNGVSDGTVTTAVNPDAQQGSVIGRQGLRSSGYFAGKIDDVRIYNRALNATEIQELYLSSARQ